MALERILFRVGLSRRKAHASASDFCSERLERLLFRVGLFRRPCAGPNALQVDFKLNLAVQT